MKYWIQVRLAYAVKEFKIFSYEIQHCFANTTLEMAFYRNLRILIH